MFPKSRPHIGNEMCIATAKAMKYVRLAILSSAVLCLLSGTAEAQSLSAQLKAEGAASLAQAARERGSAVRGAILFPQQHAACAYN